jgi:hypothetical protein
MNSKLLGSKFFKYKENRIEAISQETNLRIRF